MAVASTRSNSRSDAGGTGRDVRMDDARQLFGSYEWTNYLTGETVTQTRDITGVTQKYRWPKGTKIVDARLPRLDTTARPTVPLVVLRGR